MTNPIFTDENKARKHLETLRWTKGRICPHCGEIKKSSPVKSENHKEGFYYCLSCKKTFTVTVGTLFERSHIPLNKWVCAFHLMAASKKGMSSHQLHRMLGITYKSAWFMTHRIREAMKPNSGGLLGSGGKPVEVDETYWGETKRSKELGRKGNKIYKMKIVSLVERDGDVRSFHVARVNAKNIAPILREHVSKEARLMTDEAHVYNQVGKEFVSHEKVNHFMNEYARGDVTTNTVEGFFSILKRGLVGTFHHVSEQHLDRYVKEFDFRYNHRKVSDSERAQAALKGISGKRLTYRRTAGEQTA